jgi:hypothetical protein
MEFKKRTAKFTVEDKNYIVKFANVKQQMEFAKKYDDCKDDTYKQINVMIDFIDSLGLPRSVCEELEVSQLSQVLEVIGGSKKK